MEDEAILLKIKRDFTTNEAVQSLLKIISSLELEIGVLKSEIEEAKYHAEKIKSEGMTKKLWLKDEVIKDINHQFEIVRKKYTASKKSMEEWRQKYFNLLAQTEKIKQL